MESLPGVVARGPPCSPGDTLGQATIATAVEGTVRGEDAGGERDAAVAGARTKTSTLTGLQVGVYPALVPPGSRAQLLPSDA